MLNRWKPDPESPARRSVRTLNRQRVGKHGRNSDEEHAPSNDSEASSSDKPDPVSPARRSERSMVSENVSAQKVTAQAGSGEQASSISVVKRKRQRVGINGRSGDEEYVPSGDRMKIMRPNMPVRRSIRLRTTRFAVGPDAPSDDSEHSTSDTDLPYNTPVAR